MKWIQFKFQKMSITWCDEAFSWRFAKKIERKYFTRTNYHMCRVKFFLSRRVPRPPELQKLMGGRWFKNLGIYIFSSFFTQFICMMTNWCFDDCVSFFKSQNIFYGRLLLCIDSKTFSVHLSSQFQKNQQKYWHKRRGL